MPVDKNDFDEELEIAAIREARKHDDHALIQWIAFVMLLVVIAAVGVAMLDF